MRTVCLPGFVSVETSECPCPSVSLAGTPGNKILMVDNLGRPSATAGGSEGQVPIITSGVVAWGAPSAAVALDGTPSANIVMADGSNHLSKTASGSNGQLASIVSGIVHFVAPHFAILDDTIADAQAPQFIRKVDAIGWLLFDSGAGKLVFRPSLPVVVAVGGVVTAYSTIQNAINAAVAGQRVLIPPGLWDEHITLKAGVFVVEAFPGTVTLTTTNTSDGTVVTTADGGYLRVERIFCGVLAAQFRGINSVHTTTCTILVNRIQVNGANAGYGVFGDAAGGAGTLNLYVDEITGTSANSTMEGVEWDSGVLNLYVRGVIAAAASGASKGVATLTVFSAPAVNIYGGQISGGTKAFDQSGGGTITVHGCYYDLSSVSGTLTYATGDRAH